MKCKAKENGWTGGRFVVEGATFDSPKCPSWATPVKAPKVESEPEGEEMIALRAKAKELGYSKSHNAGKPKLENFIKEAEEAIAAQKKADAKAEEAEEAQKLADKEAEEAKKAAKK